MVHKTVLVFDDPNNFTVRKSEISWQSNRMSLGKTNLALCELQHKHPLQNTWTLWYDDPQMAKATPGLSWEANLKNIATFDTVEDFWGYRREECA
jgi:hypothetical protein